MSRLINAFLFMCALVGAFWLYQVKHEAKLEEEKIAKLEKQIEEEKQALLLLKAEWSYLNRPTRVQRLSERFSVQLGLKELEPYQIGSFSDLPERADEPEGPALSSTDERGLKALLDQAKPAKMTKE